MSYIRELHVFRQCLYAFHVLVQMLTIIPIFAVISLKEDDRDIVVQLHINMYFICQQLTINFGLCFFSHLM